MAWILLNPDVPASLPAHRFCKENPECNQYVITDMFNEHSDWILSAARTALMAVTLLCFALAFASWRRSGRRDMQGLTAETLALSALTQRLGTQIAALEARIEDRTQLVAAAAGPAPGGYEVALQMARNGAGMEQIVTSSGLARNEAQLLARLHGPAVMERVAGK